METNKDYIEAVKRFNEDVYPRIRHATAHVQCMSNILRDIAKEYGENSYAVRRIREHWTDEIQQTLLDALGCLEAKERRAIPKHFPVERPFDWAKEGAIAYYVDGKKPIKVVVDYTHSNNQFIHCHSLLDGRVFDIGTELLGESLFRTEYDLWAKLLQPGRSIWCMGHFDNSIKHAVVHKVAPPDNDADGAILLYVGTELHHIRYEDMGTYAFLSLYDLAQAKLLDRDAWFYPKGRTLLKHGKITMVNADARPSIAVLDFDDGASLTFTPETDIGRVVFLSEFAVYKAQMEGVNNDA